MTRSFDWDDEKAAANLINHRVAFEDAARVFYDPARLDRYDGREDYGEDRFLTIGLFGTVVLIVTYTMRDLHHARRDRPPHLRPKGRTP